MDNYTIIAISVLVFIFLLLTGHYISTVMFGAAMVGLFLIGGGNMKILSGYLVNDPMVQAASYTLTTVPLYVIMAQFIMRSEIIRDCYAIIYNASKGKKSILGVFTILLGGFLGAVSGSATATAASLGQISIPQLRSRGYSDNLAGAVASCAGSLSAVIPPSLMLIIYGSIAQESVGKLFMATVIPGLMIMGLFAVITVILLQTKAEKKRTEGMQLENMDMKISAGRTIFVLIVGAAILVIIFGGIYTGKFTPTEAGGFGAFIGFVVLIITKKFSVKNLIESCMETVKVAGMSTIIIIGASFFSRLITRSMLTRYLMAALGGLIDHKYLLLLIIIVIYFLLYMFLDGSAVVLMTVPILLPILEAMNIDMVWFGVLICMLCTLGSLTPPVGMSVYATSGASGVPLGKIFPVTMIYGFVATFGMGILMIVFPQLATWLPSTM